MQNPHFTLAKQWFLTYGSMRTKILCGNLGPRACIYIYIYTLFGGLEHECYFSIIHGNVIFPTDEVIFFRRGRHTTNQYIYMGDDLNHTHLWWVLGMVMALRFSLPYTTCPWRICIPGLGMGPRNLEVAEICRWAVAVVKTVVLWDFRVI